MNFNKKIPVATGVTDLISRECDEVASTAVPRRRRARILTGYALGRSPIPETALTRVVDRLYLAASNPGPGLSHEAWLLQQLDKLNRLATVNAVACGDLYRAVMMGDPLQEDIFDHIGLVMPHR